MGADVSQHFSLADKAARGAINAVATGPLVFALRQRNAVASSTAAVLDPAAGELVHAVGANIQLLVAKLALPEKPLRDHALTFFISIKSPVGKMPFCSLTR